MSKLKYLLILAVLVGIVFSLPYMIGEYKAVNYASGQVSMPTNPLPLPEEEILSISPDGTETLTVNKTENESSKSYLFKATTGLNFDKNVSKEGTISIPLNTWSPDNKYLFLKEQNSGGDNYLLFSSSGKSFSEGELYLNVSTIFAEKNQEFKIKEITGWASPVLLVINTKTDTNENGPSFWFDITNRGLIRLSSTFN